MCWGCGILRKILHNFRKKSWRGGGEKAAGLRVFLRVVLENVVCSGGFFVVSLWWIAW
jgi:hypothetical protein